MINVNFEELVNHIKNDDVQKNALRELAKSRFKKDTSKITDEKLDFLVNMYVENGVHYIPEKENGMDYHLSELEYICDSMQITLKDYGITNENNFFFSGKFVIPVRTIDNKIVFYINHNFENEKVQKYINTYTGMYEENDKIFKSYGMHNFDSFMENDSIIVVEGVFDCMLLNYLGIPCYAMLGTKTVKYHELFINRVKRKLYIGDNDGAGDAGWKTFKKTFKDSFRVYIPTTKFKDIEEFFLLSSKGTVDSWINDLILIVKGEKNP